MKRMIALSALCTLSAIGATGPFNTWHGYLAGENTDADRTTMIGAGAGGYGSKYVRSAFFGAGAGANGVNLNGCVGIGFGALANKTNLTDVTMLNGHFYADGGSFFLKADKHAPDALAPIHYSGGTLTLNAKMIVTPSGALAGTDAEKYAGYDLFLSTTGNDTNDGLTPATAKRTFDGCFDAATTNAAVCVFPGIYAPPANGPAEENGNKRFIVKKHALTFTAIEGAEKTIIEGVYANTNGYSDGYFHTMAFDGKYQTFRAFTIRKISGFSESSSHANTSQSAPAFSACALMGCIIEDCKTPVNGSYGSFNTCTLSNTIIRSIHLFADYTMGGSYPRAIAGCDFTDCRVYNISIPSSTIGCRLFSQNTFTRSLIILPDTFPGEQGGNSTVIDSTLIWPNETPQRVSPARSENCYYCVGEGFSFTNGNRNAFAPSWTNTFLNADYIPASLDCPAVRNDETRDAGWKDSGLSKLKKLYLPKERYIIDAVTGSNYVIRVENGELKVSPK